MKKLMLIAYVFPPLAYAGTYRTLRLCKYLKRIGYSIEVLSPKIQKSLHNDFGLLEQIKDEIEIIRTHTIDPWNAYQTIKQKLLNSLVGRFVNKICSLLLTIVNQPDHMVFWIPFAVFKGYFYIRQKKIKIIYTTSPPHSQHIIGYCLRKLTRVKWIVDLRDPLVDDLDFHLLSSYERMVIKYLERLLMRNADEIVVNTATIELKLKRRYKLSNISVIRNSFDEEDFEGATPPKFDKFTISHIGSLYGLRNADIILKAIRKLSGSGLIAPHSFKLLFVGLNDSRLRNDVLADDLMNYVEIKDMVVHEKALEIMLKSHMLLLIKGFSEQSAGQIPGKLFEYIGSKNKIIYIGPQRSEAADIIKNIDAGYIIGNDSDKLSEVILAEYLNFKRAGSDFHIGNNANEELFSEYTSHKMALKMGSIIEGLR